MNWPILDRSKRGKLSAQLFELTIYLLFVYLYLPLRDFEALVFAKFRLRADRDRCGELEAFFLVHRVVEVYLRAVYGPQIGLYHSLRVPGRQALLERLHVDVVASEVVLDHTSRSLAGPEAGEADLLFQLSDLRLDSFTDRLRRDLHVEPNFVVLKLRYVRRHKPLLFSYQQQPARPLLGGARGGS